MLLKDFLSFATLGATTAAQGIGFYWKYEKFIRKCESGFRGVPGATGACYVIRKSLFRQQSGSLQADAKVRGQVFLRVACRVLLL